MRRLIILGWLVPGLMGWAAERAFDFGAMRENQVPSGFRSTVTGEGKPGDWRVVLDEVEPALAPLSPRAPVISKRAVLGQLSQDTTDEHFPLLIYQGETFQDFKFTARFKTVRGVQEQMAGIAFRIQNETNYYVLRASSLGNTFRFYKVVNGERGLPIGVTLPIASGKWHEMGVECNGNEIRCRLDGTQVIPTLTDNTFTSGKVGFWTKSDSVSYFADPKIIYKPREASAQGLVRAMSDKYERLLGIKIYVAEKQGQATRLIASKDANEIGQAGGKPESEVIHQGATYYGKDKQSVSVTMPLRDQNGDIIAAVRFVMKTFPGQTEKNAVERAAPLVREMQRRINTLEDLVE